jgi:hypothetical protein
MDVSYQLHALVALSLGERTPCSSWIREREGHWNRSEGFGEQKTSSLSWIEPRFIGFPHRNFDFMGGGDKDNCDNDVKRRGKVE